MENLEHQPGATEESASLTLEQHKHIAMKQLANIERMMSYTHSLLTPDYLNGLYVAPQFDISDFYDTQLSYRNISLTNEWTTEPMYVYPIYSGEAVVFEYTQIPGYACRTIVRNLPAGIHQVGVNNNYFYANSGDSNEERCQPTNNAVKLVIHPTLTTL